MSAHEPLGLVRIGEQLIVRQDAVGPVAVFGFALPRFERPEAAELPFDRHARAMGQLDHLARHADVVVIVGRRSCRRPSSEPSIITLVKPLSIALLARGGAVAVVLVHGDRNLRIKLGRGEHQMAQVVVLRILAGSARSLHDHRRIGLLGRLHDRLNLLHVVDVERGQAVVVLGGMIQQQTHGNQWHDGKLLMWKVEGAVGVQPSGCPSQAEACTPTWNAHCVAAACGPF